MELSQAIDRLSALAQTARLQVFRLLVRTGPQGMPAGEIATELDIPAQTLSFHLKHLVNAGLIESRREGRSLIYSLQVASMQELLAFLSEDCCQGRRELCVPLGNSAKTRSAAISPKPERPTVLFLCSQNSARSQMAEALLKKRANRQFYVHSAGLRPTAVDPLTLKVLQEVGIDTSTCKAQDFGEFLGKVPIDYGIVVCDRADQECAQILPFAVKRLYWPFEDPAACMGSRTVRINKFREIRDAIDKRLRQWLTELKQTRELAG